MERDAVFGLVAAERRRLADALEQLDAADWERPSLCEGWSVHVVAAHLNTPWDVPLPTMMLTMVRSGFSLPRAMDRVSRQVAARRDPAACVAGLRDHADHRFTPPGSGPEAPLTDVVVHGGDMLTPLGRSVDVAPEALAVVFDFLAGGRAKGFLPRGRCDGLRLEATDLDRTGGPGTELVSGPALAVCSAVLGRRAELDQLDGPGVATLADRI